MRLVDADKLIEDIHKRNYISKALSEIFETIIDEQPTAYDVDKVVEELEAEQQKYKAQALETDDVDIVFRCAIKETTMQTAIDIVKRGGSIELSEHSESQGNRTGK